MCLRPHARRMAFVIVCDLWANSPICFFKRIGRLVVSHRSLRFAQMQFHSACERIRAHPLRRRRIKNQAVGRGARVKNP